MPPITRCPECGAAWTDEQDCTTYFHLMLHWEWERQLLDVHHLLVLCYHLQHPSLYSPQALNGAKTMLVQFVEAGISPQAWRKKTGQQVDSGRRDYAIRGSAESHGSYQHPIQWTMTAADVIQAGIDHYYASVRRWAAATLESLRTSGNLG